MIYSDNSINILTAKTYKGIGRAWVVKHLRDTQTVDMIVSLLNRDAKVDYPISLDDFTTNKERVLEDINKLSNHIDGIVAIGDEEFPSYRGNVKNSEQPIVLFYRGDLQLLKLANKNIAVIGLLNPDNDIEIREREVVAEFVKNGATIVSGLALGCDSIAHRQAMLSNGKTVAILPSPLTNILPSANKDLADEIIKKNGLLISEYYENATSKMELSSRYQERDRLQALFSDGIVLSASYAKNDLGNDSGSRLAMEYALSYSIPRAVIYEPEIDKNNSKFDLNKQLITEQKDEIEIINKNNLVPIIKKFITGEPSGKKSQPIQTSLFDLL